MFILQLSTATVPRGWSVFARRHNSDGPRQRLDCVATAAGTPAATAIQLKLTSWCPRIRPIPLPSAAARALDVAGTLLHTRK